MKALFEGASERPLRIFVDFDHTLFGGNSCELFFAHARPRRAIMALDLLIRKCVPWRFFGISQWFRLRDYVFFRTLLFFFPATATNWQDAGPTLFEHRRNRALERVLAQVERDRLVIITFGMESVVKAMLRGSRWEDVPIHATPSRAPLSYFSHGKLTIARAAYGDVDLPRTMLITDSEDDLDMLAAVGYPMLIWPFDDEQ